MKSYILSFFLYLKLHHFVLAADNELDITKFDDGDILIQFPPSWVDPVAYEWSRDGCRSDGGLDPIENIVVGRSGKRKRQNNSSPEDDPFNFSEKLRCGKAILRLAQDGLPLDGMGNERAENLLLRRPDTGLQVSLEGQLVKFGEELDYSSSKRMAEVANQAYYISNAVVEGIISISEAMELGIVVPKKMIDAGDSTIRRCLPAESTPFCGQCGGNTMPHDDGPIDPITKPSLMGKCAGLKDGNLQGCKCFQDKREKPPRWTELEDDFLFLSELPDYQPPQQLTCYKQDTERMKDRGNWAFIHQSKLDEAIDNFCNDYWSQEENIYENYYFKESDSVDGWDHVRLEVASVGTNVVSKDRCRELFQQIRDCDEYDEETNQYNFSWGGKITDSDGAHLIVTPMEYRVGTEENPYPEDASVQCKPLTGDGKLDDEDKMSLQMCIHHMRDAETDTRGDCGGLMTLDMNRRAYDSRTNCARMTWRCLSYWADQGYGSEAHHNPGFSDCRAKLYF